VAEPLRKLAAAKRLDIGLYDTERDRGRILAFAHDGSATSGPPRGDFPLRATIPLVDHAMDGALVMRDLRDLGSDMPPVKQAIAQGLFNTLWMPLVANGQLLGGIGFAGDADLRIDEVRSGLASEVGDQLAVALLHDRDKSALASREARLQTIIDESPNGIVVLDDSGVIRLANPAAHAMFLAEAGSLAGQPVTVFVPDAERAPSSEQMAAWFASPSQGVTHPMDTEARRSDGSHIPVHVLLAPVETPEGRIAIATIIDLSERVALESRLRQAERLETLGQFAGVLAHDVRNHLAAVTWSAELMSAELAPDSPHREDVDIIRTATRDAVAMTKSVLEYARPTGEATGVTDVTAHIHGLSRMLKRVLGDDVKLETELGPDIRKAGIDGTALTQVIVNLASNARDAMPEGGTFRIHAWHHPGLTTGYEQQIQSVPHVHIEVSDTGLGMDEATRQRAFEAFYTTKGAVPGRRGTGLGLSSVFLIVNRAGGAIRVASTPGQGTTFTVDLPIAGRTKP
jgi:PAS domain S-box-containing protein